MTSRLKDSESRRDKEYREASPPLPSRLRFRSLQRWSGYHKNTQTRGGDETCQRVQASAGWVRASQVSATGSSACPSAGSHTREPGKEASFSCYDDPTGSLQNPCNKA